MRSVRSLARIGSWAQLKGGAEEGVGGGTVVREKENRGENGKEKDKKGKDKKERAKEGEDDGKAKTKTKTSSKNNDKDKDKGTKSKSKSKSKTKTKDASKSKAKAKAETLRNSGSSFEAGHLSTSPEAVVENQGMGMGKKQSILGLNLFGGSASATVRPPTSRSGSNASSLGGYGDPASCP